MDKVNRRRYLMSIGFFISQLSGLDKMSIWEFLGQQYK